MRGEEDMKLTGFKKPKRVKAGESRDKARKMRDELHTAKKVGKIAAPRVVKRARTRSLRRIAKEVLKEFQTKFNR
jgi:hypothetical protein